MTEQNRAAGTRAEERRSVIARPLGLLLGVALPGGALSAVYRVLTLGEVPELPQGVDPAILEESFFDPVYPLPESFVRGLFVLSILAAAAALLYGVWALVRRRGIVRCVWIASSVFYSGWLTLLLKNLYAGFSLSTTGPWLVVCTLCMLPVFYSMANIVLLLTPPDRDHSLGRMLLPCIAVPILWFLIVNTLRYTAKGYALTVVLLLAVVSTYGLMFVLMRVLYLLICRQDSARSAARVVIVLVLPLLGLAVTQMTPEFSFFWDFQSPLYYLLVAVNGVLLLLPEPKRTPLRLLLLFGRCTTYTMVLYFFVCLAPFYSLAFIGILLFGLGVLVLAPVFLLFYQTRILWASGKALLRDCGAVRTVAAALVGVLVLPAAVTLRFYGDKDNFSLAMHYLTENTAPVGQDPGPVDISALHGSIDYVRRGGGEMNFGSVTRYRDYYYMQDRIPPPILSGLHNLVVGGDEYVENASTYAGLQALYFGQSNSWTGYASPVKVTGNDSVLLEDVRVETVQEGDYYRSVIHLTIREQTAVREAAAEAAAQEHEFDDVYTWGMEDDEPEDDEPDDDYDDYYSDYARRSEYATTIQLPEGVFVSDYYLDVLGQRKSGLLAERSSALWIYDTVVSSALDPGVVYYDGTDLVLRVFPFEKDEVRYTGIEFLHNGPVSLDIDSFQVQLAPEADQPAAPVIGKGGAVYVSAAAKSALPAIHRMPHYQFIVNCSSGADVEALVERIETYCLRQEIPPEAATVTALNYRHASWPMIQEDWGEQLLRFDREGGFAFGLVADALCQEFDVPNAYPVFVLVTDSVNSAILPRDTSYLEAVSPELYGYYQLPDQTPDEKDGSIADLRLYLFQASPLIGRYPAPDGETMMRVLELDGETHYLRDDGRPEILCHSVGETVTAVYGEGVENSWATALNLMGDYRRSLEQLGDERKAAQLEVVKNSFRTGLMTPLTSFIVLETPAQEELMLERQRRLLESGDLERYIDMSSPEDEDGINPGTPEPSLLLCVGIGGAWLLFRRKNRWSLW